VSDTVVVSFRQSKKFSTFQHITDSESRGTSSQRIRKNRVFHAPNVRAGHETHDAKQKKCGEIIPVVSKKP
jgi:hypothetical protein